MLDAARIARLAYRHLDDAVETGDARALSHAAWLASRLPAGADRSELEAEVARARRLV